VNFLFRWATIELEGSSCRKVEGRAPDEPDLPGRATA
jgi:hypothetical protein